MIGPYRPHGPLRWLLRHFASVSNWDVIGSLGVEDRSVAVPIELKSAGKLGGCWLLRISDPPSPWQPEIQRKLSEREAQVSAEMANRFEIVDEELMSDLPELEPLGDTLEGSVASNVILDISCLPKRFFFYLLRRLIASPRVQQLLVTLTVPERYGRELSRNAGRWDYLPSFGRERDDKAQPILIIGVGYQHLNLLEVAEESDPSTVRLLFPFPSKPPGAIQNWEFVRRIEGQKKLGLTQNDVLRVHPQATSLAFDILTGQCAGRTDEVWLAPFGPKSMSLAMVLFALAREAHGLDVSIGYTQPLAYSPSYSEGVEYMRDGHPLIHCYAIKMDGKDIYSM